MNRRHFLTALGATALLAATTPGEALAGDGTTETRQQRTARIELRDFDATDNKVNLEHLSQLVGFRVVEATIEMGNAVTGEITRMVRGANGEWAWVYRLPPSEMDVMPTEGDYAAVPFTHKHTEEERVRVISGRITAIIDGVMSSYGPGETAVVPIGSQHLFFNDDTEDVFAIVTFTRDDIGQPYANEDCRLMCLYYWVACHLGYIDERGVVELGPMMRATRKLSGSRTYMAQFPEWATNLAYALSGGSWHVKA